MMRLGDNQEDLYRLGIGMERIGSANGQFCPLFILTINDILSKNNLRENDNTLCVNSFGRPGKEEKRWKIREANYIK